MPARETDLAYFTRRARACRAQAEMSADSSIQQIHLQFATAYERRAQEEGGVANLAFAR